MANITVLTDSYKIGHYGMYPPGTQKVYSYFESRKGAKFNNTVFFGLQYLIKKRLLGKVITQAKINAGEALINKHLGPGIFNRKGWEYVLEKYKGSLPIRIMAVPEGLPIPTNNVLMTVENTDDNCHWLTNHLETLLTHVWAPSTVASLSREVKILFKHYLDQTASPDFAGIDFMLHDFGFRGVSSIESAGIEGAGHLINFKGTDTIRAIETAMDYYNSDVCAYSVLATEHSIMTSKGPEGEFSVVEYLLKEYNKGILSLVIDSYDYENFVLNIARTLKHKILGREGKTVFRPDSGEPVTTTIRVIEMLDEVFGHTVNSKGYKVLHPQIGILWGDGIDYSGIRDILHAMKDAGWSAENIVFGMGGGLLQKINRDTQRFAFKCSAQYAFNKWHEVYKQPKDVSKASKRGKLYLYQTPFGYETLNVCDEGRENILTPIFENGNLLENWSFEQVQHRAQL